MAGSKLMFLQLECVSESLSNLLLILIPGSHPQIFWFSRSKVGYRHLHFFIKLLRDSDADCSRNTFLKIQIAGPSLKAPKKRERKKKNVTCLLFALHNLTPLLQRTWHGFHWFLLVLPSSSKDSHLYEGFGEHDSNWLHLFSLRQVHLWSTGWDLGGLWSR